MDEPTEEDTAAVGGVSHEVERDEFGMNVDPEEAQSRFQLCMGDAGYPVVDMTYDEYTALTRDPASRDFRWASMLCHEEAGSGWFVGNRPDEIAVLNEQAWSTTKCMRERGWQISDPTDEEFGRFLRFDADGAFDLAPSDTEESAHFSEALGSCLRQHAVDWQAWRRANPRN